MKEINKNEIKKIKAKEFGRILYGAAFLGSGGGGMISAGEKFIKEILSTVDHVDLVLFPISDDIKSNAACVVCDIGSITALDPMQSTALKFAFDHLSANFKDKLGEIKFVFPIETGPENTLAAFVLASKYRIPVIDGDGAARAIPTLPLCTFSVEKVAIAEPVVISNGIGELMLVFNHQNGKGIENLVRAIAGLKNYANSASLALWPGSVNELSDKCIQGSITSALFCGQLLEGIRNNDESLIKESIDQVNQLDGYLIGMGPVISKIEEETGAFNFTTTVIKNKIDRHNLTVLSQNESLIVFNDSSLGPVSMAPDSICYLKSDFFPCTNAEIKTTTEEDSTGKQRLYLIGVKPHQKLMHPEIQEGFRKIIRELGYAGKMDIKTPDAKPLGDLFMELKKGPSLL